MATKQNDAEVSPKAPIWAKPEVSLPEGTSWGILKVGEVSFWHIQAETLQGAETIATSEDLAVAKFNRALRIDIAARLDLRKKLAEGEDPRELQIAVTEFDNADVSSGGGFKPAEISEEALETAMASGDMQAVKDMLAAKLGKRAIFTK